MFFLCSEIKGADQLCSCAKKNLCMLYGQVFVMYCHEPPSWSILHVYAKLILNERVLYKQVVLYTNSDAFDHKLPNGKE